LLLKQFNSTALNLIVEYKKENKWELDDIIYMLKFKASHCKNMFFVAWNTISPENLSTFATNI
jgi:hypothetical protein